jgi:hypothetical protein
VVTSNRSTQHKPEIVLPATVVMVAFSEVPTVVTVTMMATAIVAPDSFAMKRGRVLIYQ